MKKLRKLRASEVTFTTKREQLLVVTAAAWSGVTAAAGCRVDANTFQGISSDACDGMANNIAIDKGLPAEALQNLNKKLSQVYETIEGLIGKPMVAKFSGECRVCGEVIERGAGILWHSKGVISHEECPEPAPLTKRTGETNIEFGNRVHTVLEKHLSEHPNDTSPPPTLVEPF